MCCKVLSLSAVFLSFSLQTFAQEIDMSLPLRESSKAGQFYFVNGFSVAYKNQLSSSSAVRYVVDVSLNFANQTSDGTSISQFTISSDETRRRIESDNNGQSIGGSVQYLWYFGNVSIANLFLGAGPRIGFSRFSSTSMEESTRLLPSITTTSESENSSHGFSVGLLGVIGVECFLTKSVSVLGQYEWFVNYTTGSSKAKNVSTSTSGQSTSRFETDFDNKSWEAGLTGVRIGLSVYF